MIKTAKKLDDAFGSDHDEAEDSPKQAVNMRTIECQNEDFN